MKSDFIFIQFYYKQHKKYRYISKNDKKLKYSTVSSKKLLFLPSKR